MIALQKKISGDWIDIRESANDQYTLNDILKISPNRLKELSHILKLDNEEGILEYKNSVLKPVFFSLEEMKYSSLSLEELEAHKNPLEELLFVILLQKMVCSGVIPLRRAKSAKTPAENLEINLIIKDIKNRLKSNPGFKKHPAVKNIFMQISIYQKEKQKMSELLPTIQEDKRPTFKQNFQTSFDRIFESIRKNYTDILAEENAKEFDQESKRDLLKLLSIKTLCPSLTDQAREVSRLRSTLMFAVVDKYKTRESLVNLHKEKESFLKMIDREKDSYGKLCIEVGILETESCVQRVSNRFRDELIRTLDRLVLLEDNY